MTKIVTEGVEATKDKKTGKTVSGSLELNTIDAIMKSDLSKAEKESAFENTDYNTPELRAWNDAGGKTYDYMQHVEKMGAFKGDGKKEKIVKYIDGLHISDAQKKVLYDKAGYEPEQFTTATIDNAIPEDTDKYLFVSQSRDWTPEQKVEWFKSDKQRTDGKKYKAWKSAGGVDYDYIRYRGDIARYDGLEKAEKKSKVTEYINSTGLNDSKKRVLWTFAGYKETTSPW
jgi:hypothetical protein